MTSTACPLCLENDVSQFHQDRARTYLRCRQCRLIFVPPEFHLTARQEKAEYDLHRNSPDDADYRKFLSRIHQPIQDRVPPISDGLDFGSGPGPTLSVMFEEAGHQMSIYDPFYAADPVPLNRKYDFVTASEVVEHFRQPAKDLDRLWSCVRTGGLLGVMTKLALDQEAFSKWHYRNDRTHVSFFSRETFRWLAALWNAELTFVGDDVVLMLRQTEACPDGDGLSNE